MPCRRRTYGLARKGKSSRPSTHLRPRINHVGAIMENMDLFSIVSPEIERHIVLWRDGKVEELDFTSIFVAAEASGWVRKSADGSSSINLSASSAANARRVLRQHLDAGYSPSILIYRGGALRRARHRDPILHAGPGPTDALCQVRQAPRAEEILSDQIGHLRDARAAGRSYKAKPRADYWPRHTGSIGGLYHEWAFTGLPNKTPIAARSRSHRGYTLNRPGARGKWPCPPVASAVKPYMGPGRYLTYPRYTGDIFIPGWFSILTPGCI